MYGNGAAGTRPQLTQEPKVLCRKFDRGEADTGDVAVGPIEAGDEANLHRVAPGHEDYRHCRGCGFGRERRRGIKADDQGYLPAKKVRQQKWQPVSLILVRAVLDRDVLAFVDSQFLAAPVEMLSSRVAKPCGDPELR